MGQYRKALVGAALAVLAALASGLADGHLTAAEWIAAATAGVATLGAVYGVPNDPAKKVTPGS